MIELTEYVFATLSEGPEFIRRRGRGTAGNTVLAVVPAPDGQLPSAVERLEREYELAGRLDPAWALRPLALERSQGGVTLILEDPGGRFLDDRPGAARDVAGFLDAAIGITAALGQVHRSGLVHGDLHPRNVFVGADGSTRLTGFGLASASARGRGRAWASRGMPGSLSHISPEQTGRVNRAVDARSDLYSLGVILYEMLTGAMPFAAQEPMAWIHSHIARQPLHPGTHAPSVPLALEAIVLKLLAKSAEERYQTAVGLEADLRACRTALATHGRIDSFPLALKDVPDRLGLPERLYGRDADMAALVAAYDRVAACGHGEAVLVTGPAGAGKSSLVHELERLVVRRRGLFASGKFDQYERDLPYANLAGALQGLVHRMLGEGDEGFARWRRRLLDALGPNGGLMAALVPDLRMIIGEQAPPPASSPTLAQARFHQALRSLLGALGHPGRPLVLFLDDLQWSDAATLDLLRNVLVDVELAHVLVICARREDDDTPPSSLAAVLDPPPGVTLRQQRIVLGPLRMADIQSLLGDTLAAEAAAVFPLAQVTLDATGGNPFAVTQFLTALADEGLLWPDGGTAGWAWDLDAIRAKEVTADVADLLATRLQRLSGSELDILKALACYGQAATAATLATTLGVTEATVRAGLDTAARAGLVTPQAAACAFTHDRVRQAAYERVPAEERARLHLAIARALVARAAAGGADEQLFEVVNQFNRGLVLIESRQEREQVAALNLAAGHRAKAATAYAAANAYFTTASDLLCAGDREHDERLGFDLELQRGECEFLLGELDAARDRLASLSRRAPELVDAASVARLRMALFTTLDETDRAIDVGLEFLRASGVDWSRFPAEAAVADELTRLRQLLAGRRIEALIDLPLMDDAASLATMDVLLELGAPLSLADRTLFHLSLLRMATLSLEHGNCDASACCYALLYVVLGPGRGDFQAARAFGQLGCDLVDQRGLGRFRARVYTFFATFVMPWTSHLPLSRPMLRRAIDTATTGGDLTYAAYSRRSLVSNMLASGEPLRDVRREAELALAFARRSRFGLAADSFVALLLLIHRLQGDPETAGLFEPPVQDVAGFQAHLRRGGPRLALAACRYWIHEAQACYFDRDYAAALQAIERAGRVVSYTSSFIEVVDFHFYGALSRSALCGSASASDRPMLIDAIAEHHRQLTAWAAACRANFGGRAVLVEAELARLEGRELDAEQLYERAIRLSADHGFVHHQGLACELAARFHALRGLGTIAAAHVAKARECFAHWGAGAKVAQIDGPAVRAGKARTASHAVTGAPAIFERLDLDTLLNASQALSSEIVPAALVDTLMRITIEHAGAQRGSLVLLPDGSPQIAAKAETTVGRVEVSQHATPPSPMDLPETALRYVLRSHKSLILADATSNAMLADDEYVQTFMPRSAMCLPVLKQARLLGVLYLENNLVADAFTPERVTVLEFLAAQAAISLENARLYVDLRRSEAFLAEGQRLSQTGSWARHLESGRLVWSDENYRIFGRAPGEGAPPDFDEFRSMIHPEDLPAWQRTVDAALRDGAGFAHDFRIVMNDGTVKYIHSVGRPIFDDKGQLSDYVGTTIDISDRKRREDSLRNAQAELAHFGRMTTMGELAASIAHEVNQPLAAIVTNAETALLMLDKAGVDLAGVRKATERVVRDGRHAADVIRNIRALMRKSGPELAPLLPDHVVEDVLDLLRGELRGHSITLETDLRCGSEPWLGDRVQLQQLVVNLIKNAIEAMAAVTDRPRVLAVQTRWDPVEGAIVTIEDTGTGLTEEAAARMFEPFFTTKPQGMGMGLSICRSIVDAHGGRLTAAARFPHGSIFRFSMPAADARATPGE